MADEKRYYWLKLKRGFFERHDMKIVEAMPNGKDYVLFYLKLLLESIDHNGELRFSETIPYDENMLATITRTNIDVVRSAMKIFVSLGLVEILSDQTIFLQEAQKLLGCEAWSTERSKRCRESKKTLINALHCNTDATSCNVEKEIEKEIDIEREQKADKPPKPTKKTPCLSPFDDALKRFEDHRKKLKSPMTENAVELLIKKLSRLSKSEEVQIAIIDQSILNGWKGVFELKEPIKAAQAEQTKQTGAGSWKIT